MNPIRRIRRLAVVLAGLAAALAALGTSPAFGSTHPGAPPDSGLAACAYPLTTHHVTAAGYRQIARSSPPHAGRTCVPPAPTTPTWLCGCSPREGPTDTRPSGSTSGWPPPAPSTNGEKNEHPRLSRQGMSRRRAASRRAGPPAPGGATSAHSGPASSRSCRSRRCHRSSRADKAAGPGDAPPRRDIDVAVQCRNAGITSVAKSPADWRASSNVMSPKASSIAT